MNDHGRNPLWTCTRCGGLRRVSGRVSGEVHLVCTSCETKVTFSDMDEAVQAEEQLAQQGRPALAFQLH